MYFTPKQLFIFCGKNKDLEAFLEECKADYKSGYDHIMKHQYFKNCDIEALKFAREAYWGALDQEGVRAAGMLAAVNELIMRKGEAVVA